MCNVWSWDQCFNAMALAKGQPGLAMDQMLTLVDHQDEFGSYPDSVNDLKIHYNFSKPPVHGWAFEEMLRRMPQRPSKEVMETMYNSLARQADWWMRYRVGVRRSEIAYTEHRSGDRGPCSRGRQAVDGPGEVRRPEDPPAGADGYKGLPYYLHGNDSGWDNSTMFASGVPLVAPDLAALLVVQMNVLADLAGEMDKGDEAAQWKARAGFLLEALIDELWCGDHFVARLANDGTTVECDSLIPWLPIILGMRLPEDIRVALRNGIESHLTEWGLATEKVDSPKYREDGYWRGPIWAPSTYIAVTGLDRSGFSDLADTISERFCRLCARSGFAENFNALTGDSLCDPAYTWTASVFLLLAERMYERDRIANERE
jgi:glycogen debranching enzyme